MFDDLYQRDGADYTNGTYYPEKPEEQVEAEVRQKGTIASSYPIMGDVATWFKEAIADSNDLNNIDLNKTEINGVNVTMSVSAEAQLLAYQLLGQLLTDKAKEFDEFMQEREDGR
jgi:hypothetical protein